jgi:uncharacterized protein
MQTGGGHAGTGDNDGLAEHLLAPAGVGAGRVSRYQRLPAMAIRLLPLLAMLLAIYAAYLALLFAQQRSMLFPGVDIPIAWDRQLPVEGGEVIALAASFGRVDALWLPAPPVALVPGPAALYFHGNAEFVAQNVDGLRLLAARGLHVLAIEYPGHAGSAGRPSRATLAEAARLGHDWLQQHADVDPARIIAIGRSIGSGPAADLAAERPLAALILVSGFSSLAEFAASFAAPAFLIRDRFDNRARLAAFDRPVLLLHGIDDRIIPYAHGERLQASAPQARLIGLRCGHNDCPLFEPPVLDLIEGFLGEAGVLDQRPR